ncbi:HAMP domain-containing histidine kinase [archaeon]|jgi:signal transduction histidine kinase|nr:HAMP domain-containing histidine kinase [archaeon]MBT6182825.1 HAMP domain-containing histidine kinase [archaeon]MBT6606785.1 HAMP domain-containing histidine kinase [archaeon]MBT7251742.1 HAMP domain-containing histidine kinase [archaeon]MBT7660525.1 HAMP domain-containing histidine kinase [archaeon]
MKLQKSYLELQELEKLKSKFLTITSHELKTPLTPSKIQTQMLLNGDLGELNEKQKKSFEIILRNINRLDELIGDILEISQLEAEGFKLKIEKVQLKNVIGLVVKNMLPVAEDKKLVLSYEFSQTPLIEIDKKRIMEVVTNLIDNAIKFTTRGKIVVRTQIKGKEILASVSDTGPGIAPEHLGKLFIPFSQLEETFTREHGGSGLGLAICKGIVEQHGGKIWIESALGKGATFYFTLPMSQKSKKLKDVKKKVVISKEIKKLK